MSNLFDLIKVKKHQPLVGFKDFCRRLSAEGIVLLKNKNNTLPLKKKAKVAVFGRIQFHYYKSGTGSGGLVNVDKVVSIIDALLENPNVEINKDVYRLYQDWIKENPYNAGNGMWASEPWSQVEMPLNEEDVSKASKSSEVAIVVIGRTAGEDKDNGYYEGSYLLSKEEKKMLDLVNKHFEHVIVLLNVGNIIDMNYFENLDHVDSILYVWHGGMEGGRAVSDVLSGFITPSGKLVNTIPYQVEDLPSHAHFGDRVKNFYVEDIYVGYRYFETFNKKALYPFGFGLSYTTFDIDVKKADKVDNLINLSVLVKNTGNHKGKEVVQVYLNAPQGVLGKASKSLVGFAKTKLLSPNEEELLEIKIDENSYASYDDKGKTGYKSCFVLEQGEYKILVGNSVVDTKLVYSYEINETKVVRQCVEAMAPVESFKRLIPKFENGNIMEDYEDVPLRSYNYLERIEANKPEELETKNKVTSLKEVKNEEDLNDFVSTLTIQDLADISQGEGMSSPKVTSGTASAFGGLTEELKGKGIPIMCCADGPSGIRMDSGSKATSIPNGTSLACTWNVPLIEELGIFLGLELKAYDIDCLLGPGMNIHRHPFNGRNFEYFSEDPLISGMIGGAYIKGIQSVGSFAVMKHMACNSQETARFDSDSIVSERALREIYLKGFEIAIKYGNAKTIMTSYNPINGIWAAGNYDMNTLIIRDEWGFDGVIMTDWWAKMNDDAGLESRRGNLKAMIKSQNDVYMVVGNSVRENPYEPNIFSSLEEKTLHVSEMQRNAKNIIRLALASNAFEKEYGFRHKYEERNEPPFIVDSKKSEYPLLKMVKVDGESISFNPVVTTYYLNKEITIDTNIEVESDYPFLIEKNDENHSVLIKVSNEDEETLYSIITIDHERVVKPEFDYKTISLENPIEIGVNYAKFPIERFAEIANGVTFEDGIFTKLPKKGRISYVVNIPVYSKWIINFKVTTEDIGLAQIPFSTYVDDENKFTLTINNLHGKELVISEQIIIEPGVHVLSFVFNMTGLIIKEIHTMKHN